MKKKQKRRDQCFFYIVRQHSLLNQAERKRKTANIRKLHAVAVANYRIYRLYPPLNVACEKYEEFAEALLNDGHDPNEVDFLGRNALNVASKKGCRLSLFHRILGMIHNVNAFDNRGETALIIAAKNNNLDIVTALMNHKDINLNSQSRTNDTYNWTALHWAVFNNHLTIVTQLLSDYRIDSRLKTYKNWTPLMMAFIMIGRDECEKILREHGATEE
jgi:ankyrin repeat protein